MSATGKIIRKILSGASDANIDFDDLCRVLRHIGFECRIKGSHHIFHREAIEDILNLQPKGRHAKSYQVKQVRNLLTNHHLIHEDDT